jgi:uncharacterized protein (DUF2225 family)
MTDNINNINLQLESLDIQTLEYILLEELINLPLEYYNTETDIDIDINNEIERIINSSLNDNSVYKQVISDDELDKLIKTKKKYVQTQIDSTQMDRTLNNICPIMQTTFEDQQDIIKLDCNHCFDADAIIHWLKEEKAECPVCRFKFKSKEIKIENNQINNQTINNEQQELQETRLNLINSLSRISRLSIMYYR